MPPTGTQATREAFGLALFFRSRRLVVRRLENLFTAVRQNDIGLFRKVDVGSSTLHLAAGDCDLVSEFESVFVPAEVFRERIPSAQFRLPSNRLAFLIRD